MIENNWWAEKYRPKTIEDFISNSEILDYVKDCIERDEIPHLLFHNEKSGSGKTSLSKIIASTLDADVMYINASDENNVETVRDKIKTFASTIGFSKWKIIILDECLKYNTLIHILKNGEPQLIEIQNIDPKNDLILSYDIDNATFEYLPFNVKNNEEHEIFEIELENGDIVECTENHKWYVLDETNNIKIVNTNQLHKYNHILTV